MNSHWLCTTITRADSVSSWCYYHHYH